MLEVHDFYLHFSMSWSLEQTLMSTAVISHITFNHASMEKHLSTWQITTRNELCSTLRAYYITRRQTNQMGLIIIKSLLYNHTDNRNGRQLGVIILQYNKEFNEAQRNCHLNRKKACVLFSCTVVWTIIARWSLSVLTISSGNTGRPFSKRVSAVSMVIRTPVRPIPALKA